MGIIFSTNSLGFSCLNLFGSCKVGDDQVNTVFGIFANINLDRRPLVTGFFGETTMLVYLTKTSETNFLN